MVRVLNFFCVALMGLSILALYHVAEKTRDVHMKLTEANRQIAAEQAGIALLQTEWQHVASPDTVQRLAQERLGMTDAASAQLSSFDMLPRRGQDAPLNDTPLRNASAQIPVQTPAQAPAAVQTADSGM